MPSFRGFPSPWTPKLGVFRSLVAFWVVQGCPEPVVPAFLLGLWVPGLPAVKAGNKNKKYVGWDMDFGQNGPHMGATDEPRPGNCRKLRCGPFGMGPGVPDP